MNWTLSTTASKQHLTLYGLQRALSTFSTRSDRRWGIKQTRSLHDGRIIHIPKADVFRFGDTKASDAVLKDLEWTVNDGENWAVIGATPSSKSELFQVLRGRLRLKPSPPDGIFPFLHHTTKGALGHDAVLHVSFSPQNDRRISGGGGFTDYSARYGALWDEDRKTLRESLLEALSLDPPPPPPTEFDTTRKDPSDEERTRRWNERIEDLADRLYLVDKLDLPTVALSNGQARRARILRQLLKKPMLLLLDEPFSGLDVIQRPLLAELLAKLHRKHDPRIVLALRPQDPLPEWVSHVAFIEGQNVDTMKRDDYTPHQLPNLQSEAIIKESRPPPRMDTKQELLSLKDVHVQYGDRKVLKSINWTVCAGDRWHLKGANGSGKSTLCSMITGDHPQSYTQSHLHLFGRPRKNIATVQLQRKIGISSPEIFAAFPRRLGPGALTARDAIATGFDGTYAYQKRTEQEEERLNEVIGALGSGQNEEARTKWAEAAFATLSYGEQSLVLFMRALVASPGLVILDEPFAGMDDAMILRCSEHLRLQLGAEQAVVMVSHWEEEIPWRGDNLRRYLIEDGVGNEI